ncbi:MAG: NADH-quinone oxidoreductase subunit H [Acidobacteria bacterium]|nr:NADH-quinone oxidoreductase subunit H [Acidobacteriota bacterium]MCZ6751764.1 NADH-quinone oxidoreductase subunit H [Acidobacteriota bacterium]
MAELLATIESYLQLPYVLPTLYIVIIIAVFPLIAGYIVLLERKVMADIQARLGPMRVGPHGLLQPLADAVKLLLKEDIIPAKADWLLFWLAPVISVVAALVAFSVVPFSDWFFITDTNIGLLFILSISSVGILGIILGGWSSNSSYPLLGALRSTAQMVSYEVALGFAIIGGLMVAGTLSMQEIVRAQQEQHVWFIFYQPLAFCIYAVAAMAETNRSPFDMPEAESEIVAGYHTEYSGFRFSLYFLAEYTNIVIVSSIAVTLFLGGWLRPFPNVEWLGFLDYSPIVAIFALAAMSFLGAVREKRWMEQVGMGGLGAVFALLGLSLALPEFISALPSLLDYTQGLFWFLLKVFLIVYGFIWIRFTFPRYRYDQLMKLGWHWLIPLAIANIIVTGIVMVLL